MMSKTELLEFRKLVELWRQKATVQHEWFFDRLSEYVSADSSPEVKNAASKELDLSIKVELPGLGVGDVGHVKDITEGMLMAIDRILEG